MWILAVNPDADRTRKPAKITKKFPRAQRRPREDEMRSTERSVMRPIAHVLLPPLLTGVARRAGADLATTKQRGCATAKAVIAEAQLTKRPSEGENTCA